MPAKSSRAEVKEQRERVREIIADAARAISAQEIRQRFLERHGEAIVVRTLQRRLNELQEARSVVGRGNGPARRFFAVRKEPSIASPGESARVPEERPVETASSAVPAQRVTEAKTFDGEITASASEVRSIVRARHRPPPLTGPFIAYDQSLLRSYKPGETWYLTTTQCDWLMRIGRSPVAQQPIGTYAQEIYSDFLIDLSWSSTRLEGSNLTRIDTEQLLQRRREAAQAITTDELIVWNHRDAIDMIVHGGDGVALDRMTLLSLHAALSHDLLTDAADEGRLRRRGVQVGSSWYRPLDIPQLIEECFDIVLGKLSAIANPFEKALFSMVHIPYLQPFMDVNKRVSRLAANIPLIQANLCPLSFDEVPRDVYEEAMLGVYEFQRIDLLRDVFLWAYRNSCERYSVLRQRRSTPNRIRVQYREELHALVHDIVLEADWPDDARLRSSAQRHDVAVEDIEGVMDSVKAILSDLHEGLLRRYSLTLGQLNRWRAAVRPPP